MKEICLAGGCFWGMQRFIDQFDGVMKTETGYANGPDSAPSYQDVCHDSGHAETVRICYDENVISLKTLLDRYFLVIDPLSVNRQGHDTGIQYRTGVYYTDEADLPVIRARFAEEEKKLGQPLAVECLPLENFFTLRSRRRAPPPLSPSRSFPCMKNPARGSAHARRKSREKR